MSFLEVSVLSHSLCFIVFIYFCLFTCKQQTDIVVIHNAKINNIVECTTLLLNKKDKTSMVVVDKTKILNDIMEYKRFGTKTEFARFLGISIQNLSAWFKRGTFDVNKVVEKIPELSNVWLLTGEGDMLKKDGVSQSIVVEGSNNTSTQSNGNTTNNYYGCEKTEEEEYLLKSSNSLKYYYELSATASNIENIEDNELNQPYKYLNISGFEGCVGFNVMGDSMSPTAREKDIVAIVPSPVTTIANGEIYLLVTRDGQRMIKRLRVLEDTETEDGAFIRCISDNPDKELYAPFSVHTKDVHNIFRVKGFISSKILA